MDKYWCAPAAEACGELPTLLLCLRELAGRLRQHGEIRGEPQSAGCGQDGSSSTCCAAEGLRASLSGGGAAEEREEAVVVRWRGTGW